MNARSFVRDVDHGYAEFKKRWKEVGDLRVRVGVMGDTTKNARSDGPMTNVEIAAFMEFGTSTIPARSFLRSTLDKNAQEYRQLARALLGQVMQRKTTARQALDLLGMKAAADVKRGITEGEGIPPPLAASTIARKGSSRPLVDTGQLVASITWRVYSRGGGEAGGHGGGH